MFAFTSFTMQPVYGQQLVGLTWGVLPQFDGGEIFVYRSLSGNAPWDLLNEEGIPAALGYWVDNVGALMGRKQLNVHYRLALEVKRVGATLVFDSEIINTATALPARQQRTISDMMRAEWQNMYESNGVRAWLFAPLLKGIPVPGFDFQTKQMLSTGMQVAGKESYGEAYVGGYGQPMLTWIQLLGGGVQNFQRTQDGMSIEAQPVKGRFLAFPRPLPDYLIVLPAQDDRYVVGRVIEPFLFRGLVPVGYEAALTLLPRTDARYKLPVPPLPRL